MPRDISKRQSCSKQILVLVWITCNNSCLECGIIINFSILKLLDKLSLPVILWFSFERDSDHCLLNCDCRALNEGLSESSTVRVSWWTWKHNNAVPRSEAWHRLCALLLWLSLPLTRAKCHTFIWSPHATTSPVTAGSKPDLALLTELGFTFLPSSVGPGFREKEGRNPFDKSKCLNFFMWFIHIKSFKGNVGVAVTDWNEWARPTQNERRKWADPTRLEIRTLKISFCSKPEVVAWERIFLNKGNQMYVCLSLMSSESKWDQLMIIDLNFCFVHVACVSL